MPVVIVTPAELWSAILTLLAGIVGWVLVAAAVEELRTYPAALRAAIARVKRAPGFDLLVLLAVVVGMVLAHALLTR